MFSDSVVNLFDKQKQVKLLQVFLVQASLLSAGISNFKPSKCVLVLIVVSRSKHRKIRILWFYVALSLRVYSKLFSLSSKTSVSATQFKFLTVINVSAFTTLVLQSRKGGDQQHKESDTYYLSPSFASGCVTISNLNHKLISGAFRRPYLLNVIKLLVSAQVVASESSRISIDAGAITLVVSSLISASLLLYPPLVSYIRFSSLISSSHLV